MGNSSSKKKVNVVAYNQIAVKQNQTTKKSKLEKFSINKPDTKPRQILTQQMRLKFLISGYVRDLENICILSYKVPVTLMKLISNYYAINFQFISHEYCHVPDNGLSVSNPFEECYISIRYGEYFTNMIECIYMVKFNMKSIDPLHSGIGFMTDKYNDFCHIGWNLGNNNSLCLYGNSFFVTSPCFDAEMKDHNKDLLGVKYYSAYTARYANGDDIIVKIDTKQEIGIIWNYTKLKIEPHQMDKISFNNYRNKSKFNQYAFMVKLPLEKEQVAIMIELGYETQEICVEQEWYQYPDSLA